MRSALPAVAVLPLPCRGLVVSFTSTTVGGGPGHGVRLDADPAGSASGTTRGPDRLGPADRDGRSRRRARLGDDGGHAAAVTLATNAATFATVRPIFSSTVSVSCSRAPMPASFLPRT